MKEGREVMKEGVEGGMVRKVVVGWGKSVVVRKVWECMNGKEVGEGGRVYNVVVYVVVGERIIRVKKYEVEDKKEMNVGRWWGSVGVVV